MLQDSKKILCCPCTISITVVSERPIICNLAETVALEPFAEPVSLTFESTCLLDKKNKKEKEKDIVSAIQIS